MLKDNKQGATIFADFKLPKQNIYYIVEVTNQEERVNAINGEIRLIKGRIYYIPVNNKEINSDEYDYVKIFSNLADKINVVFVKEGYACIIPIVHNTRVRNKQHLCNVS